MTFIDPALFAEFNFDTCTIYAPATSARDENGALVEVGPAPVYADVPCQIWELEPSEAEGLTGEEIALRAKVRLDGYYGDITEKHTCQARGVMNNIIRAGDDGSKSVSILTIRRVTG